MYLNDKLHTLKMRESDSVTKHIHIFWYHLKQLLAASAIVLDDEVVCVLMRDMPLSYRTFISSLKRTKLNITIFNYKFNTRKNTYEKSMFNFK
jgi:hypothetical protein